MTDATRNKTLEGLRKRAEGYNESMLAKQATVEEDMKYDRLGIGVVLLAASAAFRSDEKTRFATGAKRFAPVDGGEAFHAWIGEALPWLEIRTAQNYMALARNCGLSAESGPEDVERLRAEKALEGKALRDLYKAGGVNAKEPAPAAAPVSDEQRMVQGWFDFADQTEELAGRAQELPAKTRDEVAKRLTKALEALTGLKIRFEHD